MSFLSEHPFLVGYVIWTVLAVTWGLYISYYDPDRPVSTIDRYFSIPVIVLVILWLVIGIIWEFLRKPKCKETGND